MSTFVELVRAELMAASSVTDLVGSRIYPKTAPQGTPTPYITISVVTDVPANSFTGRPANLLVTARVQVDCYSSSYLEARRVADEVNLVVADLTRPDLSAVREASRDLFENETELHCISSDYSVSA